MGQSRSVRGLSGVRVLAAVALTLAPRVAAAQDTTVSAGFNVRILTGSFGSDQTTRLVYAPAVLRVDTGRFELGAYFPYLTINDGTVTLSQGGLVPMRGTLTTAPSVGMSMGGPNGGMMGSQAGAGGSPISPAAGTVSAGALLTNQSGLGDLVASVGYRLVDDRLAGLQVVLGGRIKLPTANASYGLGTGRTDVGAVGTIRKRFADGWVYGEGGYLVVGDPDGVDLRNAVLWGVGGGRRVTGRLYVLASAYGNTALLREFRAPIEVGAGIGVRLGTRMNFTLVPAIGLSDASPRYALTVGISSDLLRR